ncbi:MAG: hypothetical protein AAB263_01610 [Planctomycetota bacterium]
MQQVITALILCLGPLVGGIILGFVQLGIYRLIARQRGWSEDRIPSFPILFARGLLAVFLFAAVMAVAMHMKAAT